MRRQKPDHFSLKYRKFVEQTLQEHTRKNAQRASLPQEKHISKHLFSYQNVNQEIIGGHLFTLMYEARFEKEKYVANRLSLLRSLYEYIQTNRAWYDLWATLSDLEYRLLHIHKTTVSAILDFDIHDLIQLHAPYLKWIVGLDSHRNPMWRQLPFYITSPFIDYCDHNQSFGRKKSRSIHDLRYLHVEYETYMVFGFGLYNEENMDLMATNAVDRNEIPTLPMPRKLAEYGDLCEFIEDNRKYTINPNGVVIDCYNAGAIAQIVMMEYRNHLLWKIVFNTRGVVIDQKGYLTTDHKGAEYCGFFNLRDRGFFPRSLFSVHNSHMEFEFDCYEILLECYADLVCGTDLVNKKFKRTVTNIGALLMQDEVAATSEAHLGFRYTPRNTYRKAQEKTQSLIELDQELKRYFVSGHLRRLPEGFNSSVEALQNALEYGIEVPEGMTFVRPHEVGDEKIRTRYIKVVD